MSLSATFPSQLKSSRPLSIQETRRSTLFITPFVIASWIRFYDLVVILSPHPYNHHCIFVVRYFHLFQYLFRPFCSTFFLFLSSFVYHTSDCSSDDRDISIDETPYLMLLPRHGCTTFGSRRNGRRWREKKRCYSWRWEGRRTPGQGVVGDGGRSWRGCGGFWV